MRADARLEVDGLQLPRYSAEAKYLEEGQRAQGWVDQDAEHAQRESQSHIVEECPSQIVPSDERRFELEPRRLALLPLFEDKVDANVGNERDLADE